MQKGECGMTNNLIITIGRQCGSGGKLIGEMLAGKMGVKC
ncbi:MAG: cytidylate kinase family protein, partial [Clostridiales bacterium]|nr:cytidylate kinase family protein [Clostridiales bacterium]